MSFLDKLNQKIKELKQNNQPSGINAQDYNGSIVPDVVHKQQEQANQHKDLAHSDSIVGKWIRKFQGIGTTQDVGEYSESHFDKSTIDMLGYRGLTHDSYNFLELSNYYNNPNGYAEILRIGGASLTHLPENIVKEVLARFINFLRAFLTDMEFVSIPLPNDSRKQQREWTIIRNRVDDKILKLNSVGNLSPYQKHVRAQLFSRRDGINESLKEFKYLDINTYNRGFVMIIFDKDENKLIRDTQIAFQVGGVEALKLSKMSRHDKATFLYRLNNPNVED